MPRDFTISCPLPVMNHSTIQMGHGSGGRLSAELIEKLFLPRFGNRFLDRLEDQAVLDISKGRIAYSTDTFVVNPIFFPGGDIGSLAVNGTVNDLAMCGANPKYLSAAFILEEGLPMADLHAILLSMEESAKNAGVEIVTGDTKVVDRGSCDKIFINTSGIGVIPPGVEISAANIREGDAIILSGTIADHGMAVMTSREGLSFQSSIRSDCAALNDLIDAMLNTVKTIHAMRDPTRGGVAATLNEWAKASGAGIVIEEKSIPVRPEVRGACEILGIDPLYVANEGKLLAAVPADQAETVLNAMRNHPLGKNAVIIGRAAKEHPGIVGIRTMLGVERVLDMPLGELLPRIC